MNDLSFNLCVVLWSPVVRSVTYFRIRVSWQSRGPRDIGQRQKWTRIGLGLINVNLQTEELHCNYSVLIGSSEQEESSLLYYPTIINFLGELLGEINYIIVRFPEYGKGEVKVAYPCFQHWGSTIGFYIRGFTITWTVVLTWYNSSRLPFAFQMPLFRRLKQEK